MERCNPHPLLRFLRLSLSAPCAFCWRVDAAHMYIRILQALFWPSCEAKREQSAGVMVGWSVDFIELKIISSFSPTLESVFKGLIFSSNTKARDVERLYNYNVRPAIPVIIDAFTRYDKVVKSSSAFPSLTASGIVSLHTVYIRVWRIVDSMSRRQIIDSHAL